MMHLVISKYAGAAQTFSDSMIINPWDIDDFARAIHDAVSMDDEQKKNTIRPTRT